MKVEAFVELRKRLNELTETQKRDLSDHAMQYNSWFDGHNVINALDGIIYLLQKDKLTAWVSRYELTVTSQKVIGLVLAGNIPLAGFHDVLCVLMAGHIATIKPSSQDEYLLKWILSLLVEIEPRYSRNISLQSKLENVDAVIATGSDNTSRYFDYYFGKYPHIIRKNRVSVAILEGSESEEELALLGKDIFQYYGLGCRNVAKLFIHEKFDLKRLFAPFESFSNVAYHSKYCNNYEYNKSIYLINKEPHLDNGFLLLRESQELVSPISVLFYQRYKYREEANMLIKKQEEKIQCIVSKAKGHVPFGKTQSPELWDYADNKDTLDFLTSKTFGRVVKKNIGSR